MRCMIAVLLFASAASAGKVVLVAGSEGDEKLITPFGCDFDSKGTLYFVEMEKGERLRAMIDGKVVTLAGSGKKGNTGDNGPPLDATFNGMHGLAIDRHDAVYLADTWNNRIRAYYPEKQRLQPFAGTGVKGKDLAAKEVHLCDFGGLFSIASDAARESLIVCDLDNKRIYRIHPMHRAIYPQLLAGNGKKGHPKDGGKAVEEPLFDPRAAAMDSDGSLYILERGGHCLRKVGKDGRITTVMGTGKAGTAVGESLESQMNGPKHLCIDKDNAVIIADAENHRILRYDPKKDTVTVVAGSGKKGKSLNDDPLKTELNRPHGVTVHPQTGVLYIVDSYNDRILKISK